MEEYPGAFRYSELAKAPGKFIDWWFESAGDKRMRRRKEMLELLNEFKSPEAHEEAVENYNLLSTLAAGPQRIAVYMSNFTRRHKWMR